MTQELFDAIRYNDLKKVKYLVSIGADNHIDRNRLNNNVENLEWADDFLQSRNRECVINAKQYCISYEKKKWRLRWRKDGEAFNKFFKTQQEATDWATENLVSSTLDKLNKPKT